MGIIQLPTSEAPSGSISPWTASGGVGAPAWTASSGDYVATWTPGSSTNGSLTWEVPAPLVTELITSVVTFTVEIRNAAIGFNGRSGRVDCDVIGGTGSALGNEITSGSGISTVDATIGAGATNIRFKIVGIAAGSNTSGSINITIHSMSFSYSGSLRTFQSTRDAPTGSLTTTQQNASGDSVVDDYNPKGTAVPFIYLKFTSRDGVTTKIYTTQDTVKRIFKVLGAEGMYGGRLYQINGPDNRAIDIAAEVWLGNYDKEFSTLNLTGYKLLIGWGFVTYAGEYIFSEPYWVVSQRSVSFEGENYTIFRCISTWQRLEYQKAIGVASGAVYSSTARVIRQALIDVLTDNADTLFRYVAVGPVWTDYSAASQSDAADDVQPLAATPAVGDIYYLGSGSLFDRVSHLVTTAGVKGAGVSITLVWEYYNGAAWVALANVVENTVDFTVAGLKVLTFTLPTDWATVAVNAITKYYIRARVTAAAGGAWTTQPLMGRVGIGRDWAVQVTVTDGIENTVLNTITTVYGDSNRAVLSTLISRTKSKIYMTPTHFVITQFIDAPGSTDYDYALDGSHPFKQSEYELGLVIPNRIVANEVAPSAAPAFQGIANDTNSQNRIGIIVEFVTDGAIISNATALDIAQRRLDRYVQEAFTGEFDVSMDTYRNSWDWVGVRDTRNTAGGGNTYTGRVGHIVREYNPLDQVYRMKVSLGLYKLGATDLTVNSRILAGNAISSGSYDELLPPGEQNIVLTNPLGAIRALFEQYDRITSVRNDELFRTNYGDGGLLSQYSRDILNLPSHLQDPLAPRLTGSDISEFVRKQLEEIKEIAAKLSHAFSDNNLLSQHSRDVLGLPKEESFQDRVNRRFEERRRRLNIGKREDK